MLLLRHASPARLEFHQRGGWGAPVLTGLVLGGFALSPLLAPGALTPARAVFATALGGVAIALMVLSRPRERGVRVALDGGFLDAGSLRVSLGRARSIALTSGGSTLEASARVRYRAELVLDGGDRVVLLEDSDPSRVIRDLRRTLGYWPLPVTSGWGLPPGAEPWRVHAAPERAPIEAPVEERGRPAESELGTGLSVLGGAVVVGTAMALMHGGRLHRGEPTAAFSYLLSGSLLGFIVLLGLFMVSDRVTARLESSGRLAVQRRALGIAWSRVSVPADQLSALHAVGLVPGEPRHLLVETADEIFSIPFVGEGATRLATRVAEWSRAARVSRRP